MAAAIATALLASVAVGAAPAGAATSIQVDAGYSGTYIPGQPAPVRVRVTADRLLSAQLEVTLNGPPNVVPIEVPGGTTKDFLVVLPTPNANSTIGPVTVTARLLGGSSAEATGSVAPVAEQEVVGLLPGALAGRQLPGTAPLVVDAGVARFVALGPLELERAPDSLLALGTIGVAGDELARQAPSVRAGLLRWVEAGGRLLVDAAPGTPVPGLPDEWQPGSGGRARVGAGEVRLTDGQMAAGRWSGLVEPTRRAGAWLSRVAEGPPLGDLLASEAGFRVPRLSWLMGFLVLYVAVAGPLLYVVLRRRRRHEMGWVVIPLVAIVFTGASYGGGRSLRKATPAVHATILSTGSQGATAVTYLGVSSRSGGTARLAYPAGWITGAGDASVSQPAAMTQVRATKSGPEGLLPLDAGQFAVVSARGPATVQGALEVTAISDEDGRVRGTVRNGTRLALERVGVLVGSAVTTVGTLRPGEQRDWSMQSHGFQGGPPTEFLLWQPDAPDPTGQRQSWTNLSLWAAAQRSGTVLRENGQVVAAGSTRDFAPPVEVGGRQARLAGQTLVVGTAPVSGSRATDMAVQAQVVRGGGRSAGGNVVRFSLPATDQPLDADKLLLRTASPQTQVWNGEAWTAVECADPGCHGRVSVAPGVSGPVPITRPCPEGVTCSEVWGTVERVPGPFGPFIEVPLPPGAVRDGTVYIRIPGGFPPSMFTESGFSLRQVA